MQKFSFKRLTAWMLTILMVVSVAPVSVYADAMDAFLGDITEYFISKGDPLSALGASIAAGTGGNTIEVEEAYGESAMADGTPVVVIAGSDYQASSSGSTAQAIMKKINAGTKAYGILFGGDHSTGRSSASDVAKLDTDVDAVYPDIAMENRIYVQGNHDSDLTPGSGNRLTTTGAHDTEKYGVYAINYEDFGSAASGLETYLNGKSGYTKPIFVMSHQPLHKTSRNDNNAAVNLFNVLNSYDKLNIIFLFGHNHSGGYDAYLGNGSIYLPKGSSITVAGGSTSTLNFTYMNYGYVGYVSGSADTTLTMSAFEITDTQVAIKRYDASGLHNLKAAGATVSGYNTDSNIYGTAVINLSTGESATYDLSADTGSDGSTDGSTGSGGGTTGGGSVSTSGGNWVTITEPDGGTMTYTYTQATSITAGEKYVIVGYEDDVALIDDNGELGSVTDVDISGTTMNSTTALTEWTFESGSSGLISNGDNNLYYGSSKFSISTTDQNMSISDEGSYFAISYYTSSGSRKTYYFYYNGSNWVRSSSNTEEYVRLFQLTKTEAGDDATPGLFAKITGNLEYNVPYGATADDALAAVKAGINVLTSASADGSNPTTLDDSDTDIKWTLASNYDGSTPGEYAVTIAYKGVTLGTAKVVVPDVGVKADDILYYIDENLTAPIGAGVTDGTPTTGSYRYDVVGGDSIITSIDDGTIHFNGTEGTAQVKITYTYTEDGTTATLEKVINVTAKAPYYTVELHDSNGLITAPIALKGVETGDTYNLTAVVKVFNGEHPAGQELTDAVLRWDVSDTSIATINPDTGVLTFTGTSFGTFQVNVYYLNTNGEPVCEDTVTFSVSESQYVVPGDGTNDFPEYPEQGAIRFDKTAVAQGNFSASGIAKVELSMTGVPYGTSIPTDVVIMVDMTTSMDLSSWGGENSVDDADAAIKNMLEALVYDAENDKFDPNIYVQVWSFKSDNDGEDVAFVNNLTRRNITDINALNAAKNDIAFEITGNDGNGTCYDEATRKMNDIVDSCATENVVAVFASDGEASRYAYLNSNGGRSEDDSIDYDEWFNNGVTTDSYLTEYHTYILKTQGIPVYTVGINIDANTSEAHVLEHMSSEYDALGTTVSSDPANATTDYFALADANTTSDELSAVFTGIAASIREAATDVVVEDKIDSHYTMNFSLPSGVTAAEADMNEFYIQVLGYGLNDNNDRMDEPTVLEKFLFNADGTITHTVNGTACGETCTHVAKTGDKITGLDGTYFDYKVDANGDEFLTWTAEKLDRTELALEYFVYLDRSAGDVAAADQVEPGTYPTNEYATITYKNFNGKECRQYFPVPTMTWMGAKVTYTFYLVNDAGQPVNRAGKVIPFAEAFYVTDPVTIDVTWNDLEGSENMLAENLLATAKVPDVYSLYDAEAYYEIRVYQTEDDNKNYFIIEGAENVSNKETTKVFNTKAGTRFADYGAYSATAGTYTSHQSNNSYTANVTTDIDYANTTVAFAVVWKPELNPDTVVIDYGLDVVIDVTTNDALASGVTGVSNSAPENVVINEGTYSSSEMGNSVDIVIDDYIIGTAKVENLTSVRFSLNKVNGMQFSEHIEFFYESKCNFYTYDSAGTANLNTTYMYSSVTVIPATSIYYEESFLNFEHSDVKSYVLDEEGNPTDEIKTNADGIAIGTWYTVGSIDNKTQSQDRPGESQISGSLDADNVYGYDSAYDNYTTYSLGAAEKVTVDKATGAKSTAPTVEFTFTGSGFDIVSLTDSDSGVIRVQAFEGSKIAEGATPVKTMVVNNYYGYKYVDGEFVVDEGASDAIYQVPVIKMDLDKHSTYTVKIQVAYMDSQNMQGDDSYSFWMDAVRIYNPAGNPESGDIHDAYVADNEYNPNYITIRDYILKGIMFTDKNVPYLDVNGDGKYTEGEDDTLENGNSWNGVTFTNGLFIDGNDQTSVIYEYANPGPNNELYLAMNQSVSFKIVSDVEPASVQIGAKLAYSNSESGVPLMMKVGTGGTLTEFKTLATATDMYYELPIEFTPIDGKWESPVLTFANTSIDGDVGVSSASVISLTNIKVTQKITTAAAVFDIEAFGLTTLSTEPALFYLNAAEETENTVELITDAETLAVVLAMIHPAAAFTPETFEVEVTRNRSGNNETVTVKTSADVETITINGIEVTKFKEVKGERTWTYKPKKADITDQYEVVAYNAEGLASATVYAVYEAGEANLGKFHFSNLFSKDFESGYNVFDAFHGYGNNAYAEKMMAVMEKLTARFFKPEKLQMNYQEQADGNSMLVVNTSEDVEYIVADGEIVNNFITETIIDLSKDGEETVNRVWLVPDADENAEVAAYNAEGVASENAENN